jgi:ABC-type transport system substrate-binding protein
MWDGRHGQGAVVVKAIRAAWRDLGVQAPNVTASWSYLKKPMRAGTFSAVIARLATESDADLFSYFHSRGRNNYAGVADDELDKALERYREATTVAARKGAREAIAGRLEVLRVVSVIVAPLAVTLVSARVGGLEFIDDLPRLDVLRLDPPVDRPERAGQK